MPFNLSVPQDNGPELVIPIDNGQCIFVLGANGTGKSSLMHVFYTLNNNQSRRISAHRQTWFSSSSLTLSPEEKRQTETNIHNTDMGAQARWKDDYSAQRANIAIYDLIDAENVRARKIASAVDADNITLAKTLSAKDAPIKVINELLKQSSIPIVVTVHQNEQVMASKAGSEPYSVAELSDGERNALLIAANVLTVPTGTLVLIDEPERHLHRSIISPLLSLLFRKRTDCAFVVSTHDVLLPLDNPDAQTLLIRSCTYNGGAVAHWNVDLVPANSPISEDVKKDILGSRKKVLFVEGDDKSLDKPIYSLIFPEVSLIAKGGCSEVENAVTGIRGEANLHWVHAFGIVDNDRRAPEDVGRLRNRGIYALAVYSVESIYYRPEIQRLVARRHAVVTGENPDVRVEAAKVAALASVAGHVDRMASRAIEKQVQEKIDRLRPTQAQIAAGNPVNITVDVAAESARERARLQALIVARNLEEIINRYPVRETPALTEVARRLGFQDRAQYENAVRKLVMDDEAALVLVRGLFGALYADITA